MTTPVVQTIDKSNLEMLLNVAMKQLAVATNHIESDPERASKVIGEVSAMISQATQAWDMQEYTDSDGEGAARFFKEAEQIVG